jgi:DNA-binding transcriptional LysR family regulator
MRKQSLAVDDMGHMAVFVRVVEAGSFAAAARSLGTTTSAASKRVARLEERLGVRLLARTTRTLSLTEPGAELFGRASRILHDIESAQIELSRHVDTPRGTLRVSAPTSFCESRVVPALSRFLERHAEVSVELSVSDRFVDLVGERFDLAIRVGAVSADGLVVRRLGAEPAVVVAAPSYLAARGQPASPDDLLRHDCLRYTLVPPRHEWRFADRRGERFVPATGRFASDHGGSIRAAAIQGLGLAWLPRFMVDDDLRDGRLVAVLAQWETRTYPIQAVLPPGRDPLPKTRAFVDFLVELMRRPAARAR